MGGASSNHCDIRTIDKEIIISQSAEHNEAYGVNNMAPNTQSGSNVDLAQILLTNQLMMQQQAAFMKTVQESLMANKSTQNYEESVPDDEEMSTSRSSDVVGSDDERAMRWTCLIRTKQTKTINKRTVMIRSTLQNS